MKRLIFGFLIAAFAALAACGSKTGTTPTSPSQTDPSKFETVLVLVQSFNAKTNLTFNIPGLSSMTKSGIFNNLFSTSLGAGTYHITGSFTGPGVQFIVGGSTGINSDVLIVPQNTFKVISGPFPVLTPDHPCTVAYDSSIDQQTSHSFDIQFGVVTWFGGVAEC